MNAPSTASKYIAVLREYHDKLLVLLSDHIVQVLQAHLVAKIRLSLPGMDKRILRKLLVALPQAIKTLSQHQCGAADIYLRILAALEETCSESGAGLLRIGLSRNDLDMTLYRMIARDVILNLCEKIIMLRNTICKIAEKHYETTLVGMTHYQPAQFTTVAHLLLGWNECLKRDTDRLRGLFSRVNLCPLGAAALAGTTLPLDRQLLAQLLGFDAPCANTYDAVAGADWATEMAFVGAILGLNLSQLVATILELMQYGVFRAPVDLMESSTYMPQKQNPAFLEFIRGLVNDAIGTANIAKLAVHNVSYADHNDFGIPLILRLNEQYDFLSRAIELFETCIGQGIFSPQGVSAKQRREIAASDIIEELVAIKGVEYRVAEEVVRQGIRADQWEGVVSLIPEVELENWTAPLAVIKRKAVQGAPAFIAGMLEEAWASLEKERGWLERTKGMINGAKERLSHEIRVLTSLESEET